MTFEDCFALLISNEGKLSMDRNDRGNWTSGAVGHGELKGSKYGISAMSYPTLDITNLTLEDAKEIYKRDYWYKVDLDKLPSSISFDMFDISVNSGITTAIKLLQKTVGSTPDGILGQQTIQKTNSYGPLLRQHLNANRLFYYTSLTSFDKQGKGWVNRIAHNLLQSH